MLSDRGAVIIDADAIAREIVGPGRPAFVEIVEEFGPDVVADDGTLDRAALADIVFRDPARRRRLEEITHPRVVAEMADRVAANAKASSVVILDVPLLLENGSGSRGMVDEVIVVAAPVDLALERAVARGFEPDDVERRIAAQRPIDEKVAEADHVIWNTGSLSELRREVDLLWRKLTA